MKYLPCFPCFGLFAFLFAAQLPAVAIESAPVPEALPADAKITGLEIQPSEIELNGRYAAVQLVITARLQSGDTIDATRFAQLTLEGEPVATISPRGQLAPVMNGAGTLKAKLGGQEASAPLRVRDIRDQQPVDFIRDVNPVMTRLGCNAGTCHGAKEGKLGFKLSLRGYDPIYDVRALKDDLAGRRLNVASPDDSLMLLKATAGVPHEGGQRTRLGEKYYEILRSWIADGAKLNLEAPRVTKIEVFPRDPVVQRIGARQQVRVVASYKDGTTRDVTAEAFLDSGNTDVAKVSDGALVETLRRGEAPLLARYEGNYAATTITVMGDRDEFTWRSPETWSRIDELVAAKWQRMKIEPSDLSNDTEFLRRVHLDLTGLPPGAEEVLSFQADTRPEREKRNEVIDRLIGSPEFVDHGTNKWADLLQVNSKFIGGEGVSLFRDWIRQQVQANVPYDQFVREILTASGSNKEHPAASYWKILREPGEAMENTTHLFLATRFNCNKCHDHPFERWTQDQYYQLGAYFSQVKLEPDPVSGGRKIEGTAVEKAQPLFEIVADQPTGDMIHLRTNKPAAPSFPFPAGTTASGGSRREQLATWITSADNRYFASSYVNRLWGYLLGVGLVEPLDDIRAGNPPTNPELLNYLTREFIEHGFDVQHIVRLICQSRTYQLSIATNRWNEDDAINYSHAQARRLPAEVIYDSVLKVVGAKTALPGGVRADQLADAQQDLPSGFLANLGRPARESACECERSSDLGLGSVMALLSGPAVAGAIGDPANALAKLTAEQTDDRKLIDELFLRVLNRSATSSEVEATLSTWQTIDGDHAALQAKLAAKEKEQAPLIAQAESDRLAAIEAAKAELARYETEAAPKIAEAEARHTAEIDAAKKAISDYEANRLAVAQQQFENTVPVARTYTGWVPLEMAEFRASGGVTLTRQDDGSLAAGGPANPTDYIVEADTKIAGITGVLLEVLPVPGEKNFGPGRAGDGNFVLTEISLKANVIGDAAQKDIGFSGAVADFEQTNFGIASAIDGKRGDGNNGWAISNQFGVPHYAALALNETIGDLEKGMRLRFEMHQPRGGGFSIARFRIWVTTGSQPLNIGLPAPVAEALQKPASARDGAEKSALAAYWKEKDPELTKLRFVAVGIDRPLPTDPGIVQRRDAIAAAEMPIVLDPALVRLRQDVEQSQAQLANKRLTGAQDLTWALINTPAFLFNH